jgi:hypothetical protein
MSSGETYETVSKMGLLFQINFELPRNVCTFLHLHLIVIVTNS